MAYAELSNNEILERCRQILLDAFLNEIDDENIRIYIFKDSNVKSSLKKVTNYVSYMENVLSLAFVFAYGCYRYDCDNGSCCYEAKKQNSIRIINSFKKAYCEYPVTQEFIRFVLSDIQLYMQQMRSRIAFGESGELYEVFSNLSAFENKFSLVKYFNIISKWRAYGSRANFDEREVAEMFCVLIENMPFLKNYKLEYDEDNQLCFCHKKKYSDEAYSSITVNHLLYIDNDNYFEEIFSLFSLEKTGDGRSKVLSARYVSGGSRNAISFNVCESESEDGTERIDYDAEDFFYETTGRLWEQDDDGEKKDNEYIINHIHAINYKYIKNLALAISDSMELMHHSRETLYELFGVKYRDIFARIKDRDSLNDPGIDWDGIIVMLLIEASPSKVLEALIESNEEIFFFIVSNLCERINNPEMPIHNCVGEKLTQKVEKIIKEKRIIGEASGFGRLKGTSANTKNKKVFARAATILIISSLSAVSKNRIICAGNIYDNEALLKDIMTDGTNEEKLNAGCVILGETFKHLLCFYKGVIAFGKKRAVIDADHCDKALSSEDAVKLEDSLKKCFLEAAKKEMECLKEYDTSYQKDTATLINKFIELSNKCAVSKGADDDSNGLHIAVGKYEIIDDYLLRKSFGTLIEDLETESIDDGDDLIHSALKILRFLTTGSYSGGQVSELNTIYPFTATYNRGYENYDGYKTVTFTLNLKKEGKSGIVNEINVLTEFEYNLGDVFYCLPNVLRSNKRWWIDPLLISFKEFNDIFTQQE